MKQIADQSLIYCSLVAQEKFQWIQIYIEKNIFLGIVMWLLFVMRNFVIINCLEQFWQNEKFKYCKTTTLIKMNIVVD